MNRLFSIVLLLCFLPIIALISLVIILDDGLPIIFRQKRVGQKNKCFLIYKFRTMKKTTPDIPTHLMNQPEMFFTRTGSFLRKYSFDELPQLLNILKGDLYFIGPRPALHNQNNLVQMRVEKGIHNLMPGITGWAQVNGRDNLSIKEKVELDHYYLINKSILLDLRILYSTINKVIKAEDVKT